MKAVALESLKDKPRDKLLVVTLEPGFWAEAGHWAHSALEVLVLLMLWAVGLLTVVMLTNVVAAPFNDFLSEEVERLLQAREDALARAERAALACQLLQPLPRSVAALADGHPARGTHERRRAALRHLAGWLQAVDMVGG